MFFFDAKKGKDILVTGRGGPWGCERSRLPHYLDKRLTDGGKVVSPTRRPPFTPRFHFLKFLIPISVRGWVDTSAIMRPGGLRKLEKIHLIGTRSRDLPACSIVPQTLRYRVPPFFDATQSISHAVCQEIQLASKRVLLLCYRIVVRLGLTCRIWQWRKCLVRVGSWSRQSAVW
jgi:hypothetical protein